MKRIVIPGLLLMMMVGYGFAMTAAGVEVYNAGIGGDNTNQMAARFERDVMERKPDLVILMAGTNDWLNSWNPVAPERYRANLLSMVQKAKTSGAEVILCEIPNAYEPYLAARHREGFFREKSAALRVAEANAIIAEVAGQNTIPLLKTTRVLGDASPDAASLFRNQANCGTEDGIHPTPAGYAKLAAAVAEVIHEKGWKPERIVCMGDSITFGVHVKPEENYPSRLAVLLEAAAEGGEGDSAAK